MFVFARSSISVLYMLHLPYTLLLLSSLICSAHTDGDPGTEFLLIMFSSQGSCSGLWCEIRYMHPLYILLLPHWPLALLGTRMLLHGPPLTSVNLFKSGLQKSASQWCLFRPNCNWAPRPRHFFHALWFPLALLCSPPTHLALTTCSSCIVCLFIVPIILYHSLLHCKLYEGRDLCLFSLWKQGCWNSRHSRNIFAWIY